MCGCGILGMWFNGGFGSVGLIVGLMILEVFSNFNDSMAMQEDLER